MIWCNLQISTRNSWLSKWKLDLYSTEKMFYTIKRMLFRFAALVTSFRTCFRNTSVQWDPILWICCLDGTGKMLCVWITLRNDSPGRWIWHFIDRQHTVHHHSHGHTAWSWRTTMSPRRGARCAHISAVDDDGHDFVLVMICDDQISILKSNFVRWGSDGSRCKLIDTGSA